MNKLMEKTKFLVLISVFSSLLASVAVFCLGAYKTVLVIIHAFTEEITSGTSLSFLQIMDTFLIGIVLLIFSTSIYSLFIKELNISQSLRIMDLHELEAKLGSLIILVMALNLLEDFIFWKDSVEILQEGIVFGIVSLAIVTHNYMNKKMKDHDLK